MEDDLQLALGEAAANGIEHAYAGRSPGQVEVTISRHDDGALTVHVRDFGSWRSVPADNFARGRGLTMIRALADEVVVRPEEVGTSVQFLLRSTPHPTSVKPAHPVGNYRDPTDIAEDHTRVHNELTGPRVEITGELDISRVATIQTDLRDVIAYTAPDTVLTLDLRATTYISSAGVGLILTTLSDAEELGIHTRLRVTPEGAVARVLDMAGIHTFPPAAAEPDPHDHPAHATTPGSRPNKNPIALHSIE